MNLPIIPENENIFTSHRHIFCGRQANDTDPPHLVEELTIVSKAEPVGCINLILRPESTDHARRLIIRNLSESTGGVIRAIPNASHKIICQPQSGMITADFVERVLLELFKSHAISSQQAKAAAMDLGIMKPPLNQKRGGDEYTPEKLFDADRPDYDEKHAELRIHLMCYTLNRKVLYIKHSAQKLGLM